MRIPQLIVIVIAAVGIGVDLTRHGELKTGINAKYNIWTTILAQGILFTLLYFGGFFK